MDRKELGRGAEAAMTTADIGSVKEFRLEVRVRNNRLIRLREELGISAPVFAETAGVNYNQYVALESLKASPVRKRNGEWTDTALKVAVFHGVSPEDLWPDAVLRVSGQTKVAELSADEAAALASGGMLGLGSAPPDPDDQLHEAELEDYVRRAVLRLDPAEQQVVSRRFGMRGSEKATFADIGSDLGLCQERVRQIQSKALRKLARDPAIRCCGQDDVPLREMIHIKTHGKLAERIRWASDQKPLRVRLMALRSRMSATALAIADVEAAKILAWCQATCANLRCREDWLRTTQIVVHGIRICCEPCLARLPPTIENELLSACTIPQIDRAVERAAKFWTTER